VWIWEGSGERGLKLSVSLTGMGSWWWRWLGIEFLLERP